MLKRITSIDLLEAGQVLGADVIGPDGACIAFGGSSLDTDGIARLRAANLSTVMVDLSDDDVRALISNQPGVEDPESLFVFSDQTHPLVRKLVEVARELRA